MICPNCDNVINATGCQACGWKTGDPFPVHRLAPNSSHPLKEGVGVYPPRIGGPRAIQIVVQEEPVPVSAPELPPELVFQEAAAQSTEPESAPAPIHDPVSSTVQ